jgi:hypothetical protein
MFWLYIGWRIPMDNLQLAAVVNQRFCFFHDSRRSWCFRSCPHTFLLCLPPGALTTHDHLYLPTARYRTSYMSNRTRRNMWLVCNFYGLSSPPLVDFTSQVAKKFRDGWKHSSKILPTIKRIFYVAYSGSGLIHLAKFCDYRFVLVSLRIFKSCSTEFPQ